MQTSLFTQLFLACVVLTTSLRVWLALRQIRHVAANRAQVPASFAASISLEAHHKAADYTIARGRLGLLDTAIDTVLLLFFTLGGGLQWLDNLCRSQISDPLWQGVALVMALSVLTSIIGLPMSLYRTFVLEARFGFNQTTLATFIGDMLKQALLGALLGIPLLWAVLWLMAQMGANWWMYVAALWIGFNLLLLAIYPTFIAPLFNKFSPLEASPTRERIEALLARCGFASNGLFVMDGSKRSSHGNAYFTGFGKSKRIVFFDTLLKQLEPGEIEAVLAHELGHFKHKHVLKRILWTFAASTGFLWLLAQLMLQPWFFQGLGVNQAGTAMALVLFMFVLPVFLFPLTPLSSLYSRKHEFEADAYAASQASAGDLVTALVKLYRDNASTLTPDPLHSAFYDSHPPAAIRIQHLQGVSA
jgi:STE24 endopeptidase